MAIIYSYPIATPKGSDYITISRIPEDPEEISNYSIDITSLASLINTGQATIIQVDDRVVTGASFNTGTGVLTLTRNGGEIPSVTTNLDGRYYLSSKITATSNYIPKLDATGSLVNSVIYQDGDGHVGIGVPGSPPNPIHKFEVYDDRSENISSDYTQVNSTVVGPPWTGGGGGILSRLSTDAGSTFPYGISLIPGTIASDIASSDKMAFHANSDLDTRAPSGFSGFISHDGANPHWQIGGAVTDPNPTQTLKVVGTGEFTGQVTIPQTPINPTDAASKAYVDAQSGGGGSYLTFTRTFTGNELVNAFNGNPSDSINLVSVPNNKIAIVIEAVIIIKAASTGNTNYNANASLYIQPSGANSVWGILVPNSSLNVSTDFVQFGIESGASTALSTAGGAGADIVLAPGGSPCSITQGDRDVLLSVTYRLLDI